MAARFWVGGTGNWDAADTTHWSDTSGGAGGQTVPGASDTVTLDGSSGGGTVTVTADQTVTSITSGAYTGTIDFGTGRTINASFFDFGGTATRTLTLGDCIFNLTFAGNALRCTVVTNLTMTANTATVNITGAAGAFQCTSFNYNGISIVFSGSGNQGTNGVNGVIPTVLNCTRTGTAVKTDILSFVGGITCTGTFTCNGNSAINRVLVQSNTVGTARTITAATVTVTNSDFMDITGAGAGSWDLSAITGNSGDCGGNSGITFTTAATQTYTGGTDNWSTAAKWTSRVPLPQDDVVMSGVTGGTITADMPRLGKSIDWTGASGTPAWASGSLVISIFGSITLISAMTISGTGVMTLAGRGSFTITSAGKSFTQPPTLTAPSGTYTLTDAYSNTGTNRFNINNGTFNDGGFNVTIDNVSLTGTTTRGLTMSSTWTLTSTGAATVWNATTTTGLTFSGASATIVLSGATSGTKTFIGGGLTYGTLTYTVAGSTGQLNVTGSNSFAQINFSDITNARSLLFTAATTTTIRNASGFNVQGTSGKLMTIASVTAATHTLSSTGLQSCNYLHLTNSIATGGGSWYAGANSTDGGNNSGWIFTAPPSTGDGKGAGSIQSLLNLQNLRSL